MASAVDANSEQAEGNANRALFRCFQETWKLKPGDFSAVVLPNQQAASELLVPIKLLDENFSKLKPDQTEKFLVPPHQSF